MTTRQVFWGIPICIWLLFTYWYTDFGGPLSEAEVAEGIALLAAENYDAERLADIEAFLRRDTGRQFLMVNNIDMNETPPEMPGFGPDATASALIDHYMEHMYKELLKRACHPIFFGNGLGIVVDLDGVDGPAASGWDSAALFRYRSRRSLLEVITHPQMQERHDYKLAAMTKTIAYPVEPRLYVSDLRFILFLALGLVAAFIDNLVFRRR